MALLTELWFVRSANLQRFRPAGPVAAFCNRRTLARRSMSTVFGGHEPPLQQSRHCRPGAGVWL